MIHYHGTPITPERVAEAVLVRRHAFVSFARPDQIAFVAEACQSFAIDNGAFSFWRSGAGAVDAIKYCLFVGDWCRHPGFDWCVIPDVIDGTEQQNDALLEQWDAQAVALSHRAQSVPVWHLHESIDRLERLCEEYPRVALGSSGEWSEPGSSEWWQRMGQVLDAVCNEDGYPPAKLHGLRMLNPTIFSQIPLSSADSTNVAQNHSRGDLPVGAQALLLARRIEEHACARRWTRTYGHQHNMDLVG